MDHKTETDAGRAALEAYLKDCDRNAIVPDVGGAWHAAFQAGRASLAASAGSEPVYAGKPFAWYFKSPSRPGEKPLVQKLDWKPRNQNWAPLYTHPSPPEGAGWRQGVEAAAALLSKKADDFAREHGYDDMGGLSFGRGSRADAKLDYHSSLIELAEEVRAILPAPPASEAKEL